jgi:hypothetical protein
MRNFATAARYVWPLDDDELDIRTPISLFLFICAGPNALVAEVAKSTSSFQEDQAHGTLDEEKDLQFPIYHGVE